MNDLIPAITLTEFKKLKASELKKLKSCEIISDGEYIFTAITQPTQNDIVINDNIRTKASYLGVQGNSAGGLTLEEIKGAVRV
jgi:hypothetical protein